MENRPILTIGVPTYNGSATIKNMLDILIPQCDDRVEILISDNCSTDSTPQLIREYKKQYSHIVYSKNDMNVGTDENIIKCLDKADGAFVWLMSDDDIAIDGSVAEILNYLNKHPDIGLLYLTTVHFRGKYMGIESCCTRKPIAESNIYTLNKCEFMYYAGKDWGFLSSFILSKEHYKAIDNPRQYVGTFWLQSYIHTLCAKGYNTHIGVIAKPCVAAGIYGNIANFDSAQVDGVAYKELLDFMSGDNGFDNQQLKRLYCWRMCLLGRHGILKEKSLGIHKLNKKLLFKCMWKYPKAWITLFPFYLVPSGICRIFMKLYRQIKGLHGKVAINRPNDSGNERFLRN